MQFVKMQRGQTKCDGDYLGWGEGEGRGGWGEESHQRTRKAAMMDDTSQQKNTRGGCRGSHV